MLNDMNVMSKKRTVYTRLDDDTLGRIDRLISAKKYDNRASFIRRATIEKLERDTRILA